MKYVRRIHRTSEHRLDRPAAVRAQALPRHHAAKAAVALQNKQNDSAGKYLGSAVKHLQLAYQWSGRDWKLDAAEAIDQSRLVAMGLLSGELPVKQSAEVISKLHEKIVQFGKLGQPTPAKNPQNP